MGIKELESIVKAIPVEYLKGIKATNAQPASERTIRFDVPTDDKDVVKRIKVTATQAGFTIRLYEVKQTDQVDMVSAENLVSTIDKVLKGELPKFDISTIINKE